MVEAISEKGRGGDEPLGVDPPITPSATNRATFPMSGAAMSNTSISSLTVLAAIRSPPEE